MELFTVSCIVLLIAAAVTTYRCSDILLSLGIRRTALLFAMWIAISALIFFNIGNDSEFLVEEILLTFGLAAVLTDMSGLICSHLKAKKN